VRIFDELLSAIAELVLDSDGFSAAWARILEQLVDLYFAARASKIREFDLCLAVWAQRPVGQLFAELLEAMPAFAFLRRKYVQLAAIRAVR